ncbi:exopolysaccharide biosynthesis polyprenyl glycosylphosphotransferase [Streptomyces sp. TR06-5]|uniref:exopolysaccharide biosynthesis polyprenyl glycosylphosphotransferase n=1 Tax=unclassified Streptomyces TaxID=2593676 RepID=UPI0039A27708
MQRDALGLSEGGRRTNRPAPRGAGRRRSGFRGERRKARWYVPAALTTDVSGTALPVLLVLGGTGQPRPVAAALLTTAIWPAVRAARRRYARESVGESRGVLLALQDWLTLLGLLAVLQVLTEEGPAPGTALLALAPAPVLTGLCGTLTHRHLKARRRAAQALHRALVVGEAGPVDRVVEQLAGGTDHAYVVVGAVTAGGVAELPSGVPRAGRLHDDGSGDGEAVLAAVDRHAAETVLVVPGTALTGERLRRLTWAVQDAGLPLVVASGLTEVALRRVRTAAVAGLNLLHIAPPVRDGLQSAVKNLADRACAALGLLLLAPLLALVAAVVRLDSPGPALYRQVRVGQGGRRFVMWKFRSMVPLAEELRPALAAADEQDGPLFKIRRDPRVTRVGRVLRRTSLDELPQLLNVLRGEMSLVGPRPPLPGEVDSYGAVELRRLGVKPGMTGPWQVSGRSDLSWDEGLALDLRYADNWSLTTDLDVLARTFRAVLAGRGAY